MSLRNNTKRCLLINLDWFSLKKQVSLSIYHTIHVWHFYRHLADNFMIHMGGAKQLMDEALFLVGGFTLRFP